MDLFRAWDDDGDGLISKKEFRRVITILGFEDVPRAEVDAIFDELDEDGSGEIEYFEMKKAIEPPLEDGVGKGEEDENLYRGWSAVAHRRAAKSLSERTNNAAIVRGIRLSPDYDIISQLSRGLAANWARLGWIFNKWDVDNSGTISRSEIQHAMGELDSSQCARKYARTYIRHHSQSRKGQSFFSQ